LIPPDNKKK